MAWYLHCSSARTVLLRRVKAVYNAAQPPALRVDDPVGPSKRVEIADLSGTVDTLEPLTRWHVSGDSSHTRRRLSATIVQGVRSSALVAYRHRPRDEEHGAHSMAEGRTEAAKATRRRKLCSGEWRCHWRNEANEARRRERRTRAAQRRAKEMLRT